MHLLASLLLFNAVIEAGAGYIFLQYTPSGSFRLGENLAKNLPPDHPCLCALLVIYVIGLTPCCTV